MTTAKSLFAAEGIDDRSLEFLTNALEQNNLPGFDYFEFKRALVTLRGMEVEEGAAHKSAFATAATIGLTKDKLIETANYYRNFLEKEKEKFNTALKNQMAAKVTSREDEIKRLTDQIERHKADIARLQEEMAVYRQQIDQATTTMTTEKDKITKASDGFEKTHASVLSQIDRDIENIHKYI